jgi:DtxR family Mn-dependent transcriptional regulator
MTLSYEDESGTTAQKTSSLLKCLTECTKNTDVKVVSVDAGKRAKHRLANLGIIPGSKISKTRSAVFNGPIEINVRGSKIVLGRGLAAKIVVKCDHF